MEAEACEWALPAAPKNGSRFVEMLHLTPTLEELKATGALTDPFPNTRAILAASASAPSTPNLSSSPVRHGMPSSALSKLGRRLSWRSPQTNSNLSLPSPPLDEHNRFFVKHRKARVGSSASSTGSSPPTMHMPLSPTSHNAHNNISDRRPSSPLASSLGPQQRPSIERSVSAPFSIPKFVQSSKKRASGLFSPTSPRFPGPSDRRSSIQLPATDYFEGISSDQEYRPSFEILSRPPSKERATNSPSRLATHTEELPPVQLPSQIATPQRNRVLSTPSSSARRRRVSDVFINTSITSDSGASSSACPSSSSPEEGSYSRKGMRRHSLASVSSLENTPPLLFSKRPLFDRHSSDSSASFVSHRLAGSSSMPSGKSGISHSKPPSIVLLPLAAATPLNMPALTPTCTTDEASESECPSLRNGNQDDDPFLCDEPYKDGFEKYSPVQIAGMDDNILQLHVDV